MRNSRRRILLLTLFTSLAAVILYLAVGALFCAATLYVPRPARPMVPPRASAVNVEIPAPVDNVALKAWYFPAQSPRQQPDCVILLHGIADSRQGSSGFAPWLLDKGYAVLTPDSRAHGESGGDLVTYGYLEKHDVLAWARWFRSKASCRHLYGLGESLGASILIQAAAQQTTAFDAIVAECPYANLADIAEYRVRQLTIDSPFPARLVVRAAITWAKLAWHLPLAEVSPITDLPKVTTPILLIHGTADTRTPPIHSRRLAAVNPARHTLWLVPNAPHTGASGTAPAEFRTRVEAHFSVLMN